MDRATRDDRARGAAGAGDARIRGGGRDLRIVRALRAAFVASAVLVAACGRHAPPARGNRSFGPPLPLATPSPAPAWSTGQRSSLARTLDDIFVADVTRTATGLAVVSGDGTTLYARRATVPVAPASTLKLVVAASALDALGPKHRFETRFVAAALPDAGGTIAGDLWLVGGGDPSLTSGNVRDGVGAAIRGGLRRVDGSLLVDDTAFSGPEQNPRWDPDDLSYDYAAGTSAISLDEDTVEFDVAPDPGGGAAHVSVVPPNESIAIRGSIATGGSNSFVTIERDVAEPPTFGRAAATGAEPRARYRVDGNVVHGETQIFYKPVLGLPEYVGGAVAAMFDARRVPLAGGFGVGTAPLGAVPLWTHRSAPLADLLREMLVNSNNHTAETLLRFLGETRGRAGTDASGIVVEKRELSRLHVPRDGMAVYDGSGLAPSDRIMPLALAKLIALEARGPYGDTYVRALPRVGMEGTVKHHDLHDAFGRTRAKSGHIANVNGLAGIVQTRRHGRVAFAFVVNDPRANADVVYEEEDRALDALSEL